MAFNPKYTCVKDAFGICQARWDWSNPFLRKKEETNYDDDAIDNHKNSVPSQDFDVVVEFNPIFNFKNKIKVSPSAKKGPLLWQC